MAQANVFECVARRKQSTKSELDLYNRHITLVSQGCHWNVMLQAMYQNML